VPGRLLLPAVGVLQHLLNVLEGLCLAPGGLLDQGPVTDLPVRDMAVSDIRDTAAVVPG
jgi:hypothetical protein